MLPELNDFEDKHRHDIIEAFLNEPTIHGTKFDNGKRWCAVCESPYTPISAAKIDPKSNVVSWKARSCPCCNAIWPEYMYEFVYRMENDPEFHELIHDEFGTCVVN